MIYAIYVKGGMWAGYIKKKNDPQVVNARKESWGGTLEVTRVDLDVDSRDTAIGWTVGTFAAKPVAVIEARGTVGGEMADYRGKPQRRAKAKNLTLPLFGGQHED